MASAKHDVDLRTACGLDVVRPLSFVPFGNVQIQKWQLTNTVTPYAYIYYAFEAT